MKHRWNAFYRSFLVCLPCLLCLLMVQPARGMDPWFRSQFQLEILNGRLCLLPNAAQYRGIQNRKMENRMNGKHILRQVNSNPNGDGSLQVMYMTNDRKEHVDFKYTPTAVTYLRIDKNEKTYTKFSQLESPKVRIETGKLAGETEQWLAADGMIDAVYSEKSTPEATEYTAPTLWDLILFAPEEMQKTLDAVLNICADKITVASLQAKFLVSLVRVAELNEKLPAEDWCLEQIAKLGDDQFAVRQAADRELRKVGPLLQAVLDKVDQQSLDPEQRMRLHRMLGDMKSLRGDEALDYTVRSWRTDPRVWFVLLTSPDITPRIEELAINQIKQHLGEVVVWEFQADEAVRRQNLETLRRQVGL